MVGIGGVLDFDGFQARGSLLEAGKNGREYRYISPSSLLSMTWSASERGASAGDISSHPETTDGALAAMAPHRSSAESSSFLHEPVGHESVAAAFRRNGKQTQPLSPRPKLNKQHLLLPVT